MKNIKEIYLYLILQLRLGSGSTALYRCTVHGNGVAPALNTFSLSMQFFCAVGAGAAS
jgi:hypothetical protein